MYSPPPHLAALARASQVAGADPDLVQGAGGNSSVKCGGVLWVKASGCWLSDALTSQIFVPLSLAAVRDNIEAGAPDPCRDALMRDLAEDDKRPSIEASLHALMPHNAVFHTHSVNATVAVILAGGAERACRALESNMRVACVPYVRPGPPLTAAIKSVIDSDGVPDVVLLGNHGVVVGADSPDEAIVLLREVERRLSFPPRTLPEADPIVALAFGTGDYRFHPQSSGLALDPFTLGLLTGQALVPDQVVFLGGAAERVATDESLDAAAERVWQKARVRPTLLLVPGVGAFVRRDCSEGASSVLSWLVEIARRIPAGSAITGLPGGEVASLLGWEAEQYRQKLDQQRQTA